MQMSGVGRDKGEYAIHHYTQVRFTTFQSAST